MQISDVHLGIINSEKLMKKIVKKINSVSPAALFITGDLFDGSDGDLDLMSSSLTDVRAERGIFFISGNHETYLGTEIAYRVLRNKGVKVLNDEVVDVGGLKIAGISYSERGEHKNIVLAAKKLEKDFRGKPNILLCHSPRFAQDFRALGVNLQLSGHSHKGQIFPFGFISRIIFNGYDYGLFVEGDYTLYTTSGTATWGPAMRTEGASEIAVITLR